MPLGTHVEIRVTDLNQGRLGQAVESMGVFHVIAQNGIPMIGTESIYTSYHPRTLMGIRPDGSYILMVVDGRQQGLSHGLNLSDATEYLIQKGCMNIVNLDGGGSSTIIVRKPGLDKSAKLVNSPSDGAQRAVTSGLFLVYVRPQNAALWEAQHLHIYPENALLMPGAEVMFQGAFTNSFYEKISYNVPISFFVQHGTGKIDGQGRYTAGEEPGKETLIGQAGDLEGSANAEVVTDFWFYLDSKTQIDPGENLSIDISAAVGNQKVIVNKSLFTWSCDPKIGAINDDGVFTATASVNGLSGEINATYNGKTQAITVTIGEMKQFTDIIDHWAEKDINYLTTEGIVSGIGDGLFAPDEDTGRAQLVTLLHRIAVSMQQPITSGTALTTIAFSDVLPGSWYEETIRWAQEANIVNGFGELFMPDAPITREQLAVVLQRYIDLYGIAEETEPDDMEKATFIDTNNIGDWALPSVMELKTLGILQGADGMFRPQDGATRAEVITVIRKILILQEQAERLKASQNIEYSEDFTDNIN
jgi:hypothetical protein